jgi:hypothetical protein
MTSGFMGFDGASHNSTDPDYREAKLRELEHTVHLLTRAVVDLQYRVAEIDGGNPEGRPTL